MLKSYPYLLSALMGLCSCTSSLAQARPELKVKEEHQRCTTEADCVIIETRCDSCSCGAAVNAKFEQQYRDEYDKMCADYAGSVCRIDCSTPDAHCKEGKCVLE